MLIAKLTTTTVAPEVVKNFLDSLPEKALNLGIRVICAILFFLIGVQVIKLLRKIVKKSLTKANADIGAVQFVDSFLKAALYVVLVFMIATSFGLDAASVVALLGSAGVAIGLAVQGSLSNLAGGVLILLLKPFKVGDYIVSHGAGQEGSVTEIQIFYTKLATGDNKTVIIPNGVLANNSITNVTAAQYRRVDIIVGISYNADIKAAKTVLAEVIDKEPLAVHDKEKAVFVSELAASSVNMGIRCWCKKEDYWSCKFNLNENAKLALDAAHIEIPFNQLDVHMK